MHYYVLDYGEHTAGCMHDIVSSAGSHRHDLSLIGRKDHCVRSNATEVRIAPKFGVKYGW